MFEQTSLFCTAESIFPEINMILPFEKEKTWIILAFWPKHAKIIH